MMERIRASRTERKTKQTLPIPIAREVIGRPEEAVTRRVALDQPVVLANTGPLEGRALRDEIADVRLDIDALLSRQLLKRIRQLEQNVAAPEASVRLNSVSGTAL